VLGHQTAFDNFDIRNAKGAYFNYRFVLKGSAMSYATLMVYVDADNTPEQRVHLAASLADKFNATLIGLSALAIRSPFVAERVVIQEVIRDVINEIRAKLASKENWFRSIAGDDHRKLEWRPVLNFPSEALAREARSADLVVLGQSKGVRNAYTSLDLGRAVLKIGRPTLVVPNGVDSLRAAHVVIGWKDTREARRAVQDSLPFLREATRVTIVGICESGEENAARERLDDVARYLMRHRISGSPRVILHQEGSGAALLIRFAQDEAADLLVTGAYGHSRLGEWILGGMTQDLLATSPICCLMSH
jgi:nucleotide-binding universal stress UspA family protein